MPYADEMKRTQEVTTNAIKNLSRNFTSTASSVISLRNASHKGKKYPKRENSQLHVSLCSKVGVAHGKFDRYKSLAGNQHQMQQRAYAQKRRKMLCTSAAMLLVLSPSNSKCFIQNIRRLRCETNEDVRCRQTGQQDIGVSLESWSSLYGHYHQRVEQNC